MKRVVLGEVDFYGQKGIAIREMIGSVWTFIIQVGEKRIRLLTY